MENALKPSAASNRESLRAATVLLLLATCAVSGAWSAGSARIVFGGWTADDPQSIYLTTPNGATFENLTRGAGSPLYPAWSHDGRTISMSYTPNENGRRIYLMDADGGNLRPLTQGDDDYGSTWAPRNNVIAFTSSREGSARRGVYVIDVDGGDAVRLTAPDAVGWQPNWRPLGDAIAYSSNADGRLDIPAQEIFIMDSQGRHTTQVTGRPGAADPNWHPHRSTIAFASWDAGHNGDVYTINADGSDEQRLTKHPAADRKPRWSPDGTQILFESRRDGQLGLFIMEVDGHIVRKVTDERFTWVEGSSWFDPDVRRSISPVGKHATTWGWMKRLGSRR